jgi:uncharacterized protein YecT (DUF1311 family)
MMKAVFVLLGVVLLASAADAKVTVADKAITRKSKTLEVDVHYPVTGRPAIDRLLADYARARVGEVSPEEAASDPSGNAYSDHLAYRVTRNDDQFFTVFFTGDQYTGGAHPMHFQESFVFLMPDGAQTFLPELVDGGRGMAELSRLAIADLTTRLLKNPADAMTTGDWIRRGATPAMLSQVAFEWNRDALVLHFGEYAVAPYAAGPQAVRLAMTAIAGITRPNPRAPAPSFDCAKAASAIEKSVCANAALARLDRQVGEAYARRREADFNPKARTAVLAEQRSWLAARNKACGGGDAACLSDSYRKRLAALQANP